MPLTDKQRTLLKRAQRMTEGQLKKVVADYYGAFPGWKLSSDHTAFFRTQGPISQLIWFDKLSSAEYRPTHVINSTVLPQPSMLHQFLDIRNRQIKLSQHEKALAGVVAAMEQQLRPSVRQPLDVGEVLELCKLEARSDATGDLAMLAILFAWQGQNAEATAMCEQMQHCPLPQIAAMPEWEAAMRAFGRDLAAAIRAGKGRPFLEETIAKSRPA